MFTNNASDLKKIESDNQDLITLLHKTGIAKDISIKINQFVNEIIECKDGNKIEKLSDITQNFYQSFSKWMDENYLYQGYNCYDINFFKLVKI